MKKVFLSLVLLSLSGFCHAEAWFSEMFNSTAEAVETPINTGVQGKTFEAKQLSVELNNINDIGLVFVMNTNDGGLRLAGSAEQTAGLTGTGTIDINPFLKNGTNTIIFILWNKKGYNLDLKLYKPSFLSDYSYDFKLIADGTTLYNLKDKKEGKAGVNYFNAFFVNKSGENLTIKPVTKSFSNVLKAITEKATQDTALINTDLKNADIVANIAIYLLK